jgi:hypothetical protein
LLQIYEAVKEKENKDNYTIQFLENLVGGGGGWSSDCNDSIDRHRKEI